MFRPRLGHHQALI